MKTFIPEREPDVYSSGGIDVQKAFVAVMGFLWAAAWAVFGLLVPVWLIALMWRSIVQ